MRGRSYTPSPPRDYGRRGRSPPRGHHRGGDGPTSILVRNLRHDCRPEDLKRPFSQFGQLKDVYLPRDYYTGEPRGFGFVQFMEPADAAEAKYEMDGQIFQGREITVVFAEENRKRPAEMRARGRGSGRFYDRRRSPPRRRSRSPAYSHSPPPRHERSRGRDYHSPAKRRYSRSVSPRERSYGSRQKEGSYSPRSPAARSRSPPPPPPPPYDDGRRGQERSPYHSRSRSHSPVVRGRRSPSRSRSGSPYPEEEHTPARGAAARDRKRSPPPTYD